MWPARLAAIRPCFLIYVFTRLNELWLLLSHSRCCCCYCCWSRCFCSCPCCSWGWLSSWFSSSCHWKSFAHEWLKLGNSNNNIKMWYKNKRKILKMKWKSVSKRRKMFGHMSVIPICRPLSELSFSQLQLL